MTGKLRILGITVLVLTGLFVGATAAYAQGPTGNGAAVPPCGMGGGYGGGAWRWAGSGGNLLSIVAEELGMTPQEVIADLGEGQTVLDYALEQGLTVEELVDAMMVTREEGLQAAVEAGRISQEQADYMIEHMTEEMIEHLESGEVVGPCGGRFAGRGGRMGGMMGFGGRGFVDSDGDGICDSYGTGRGTFGGRWNATPSRTL